MRLPRSFCCLNFQFLKIDFPQAVELMFAFLLPLLMLLLFHTVFGRKLCHLVFGTQNMNSDHTQCYPFISFLLYILSINGQIRDVARFDITGWFLT